MFVTFCTEYAQHSLCFSLLPRLQGLVEKLLDEEKIEDVMWTLKACLLKLDAG